MAHNNTLFLCCLAIFHIRFRSMLLSFIKWNILFSLFESLMEFKPRSISIQSSHTAKSILPPLFCCGLVSCSQTLQWSVLWKKQFGAVISWRRHLFADFAGDGELAFREQNAKRRQFARQKIFGVFKANVGICLP